MASLVNTKTYEAATRMYGIFVPRTKGDGDTVVQSSFFVRVPSYTELPEGWRDRVLRATEALFGSFSKDSKMRKWTVGNADHDMLVFRSPGGMGFRESLGEIVKNIPLALGELGLQSGPGGIERIARSFERLLEDYDIAAERETGDKEVRIIASDLLSRAGLIFQAPFIAPTLDNPEEDTLEVLHDKLFSAEFGPFLSSCRDLGLVQTHVFGISPFPVRGGDLFSVKNDGIEIKIGWDGLLNSRPAMDALTDMLLSGKILGDSVFAPAEIRRSFTGKSGYTGDPNGIRSLSGETLFVKIPAAVKEKEDRRPGPVRNFISALHAVLSPWLDMTIRGDLEIVEEDRLHPAVREIVQNSRDAAEEKSNVYQTAMMREKEEREERRQKTEKGMDLTSRIVPYPGKAQLYMLLSGDADNSPIRDAVGEFVAAREGLNPPEWRENRKYQYDYTYITANREASVAPLSTLEGRVITARELSDFIRDKTGAEIGAVMPDSMKLTLRVGGLAGRKGETYLLVEVPASTDRDIRKSAKKDGLVISDESAFLGDIKKTLSSLTFDEDDPCEIDGAGELLLIASDDRKTVFGVDVTPIAGERSILEEAVKAVESFVESEVIAPLKEKYEGVNTGVTVKFTKDERMRERERELRQNLREWQASMQNEATHETSPEHVYSNEPGF